MSHHTRYADLAAAIWAFRGFIYGSVARDFRSRYMRSALGLSWTVIEPLSMILIYTLVFSAVMKARLPGIEDRWSYSIYLCAGILTWGFFSETLLRCQTVFLDNATLIKKVNFPRITLPLIVALSCTIDFAIIFSLLALFLMLVGRWPGWSTLSLLPLLLIQQGLAIGLGMVTGTLNVFFRDIGKTTGVLLTFWFWFTPIVYPASIIPEIFREFLANWNPLYPLVSSYHELLLNGTTPSWSSLYLSVGTAMLSLAFGWYTFMQMSSEMIDEL